MATENYSSVRTKTCSFLALTTTGDHYRTIFKSRKVRYVDLYKVSINSRRLLDKQFRPNCFILLFHLYSFQLSHYSAGSCSPRKKIQSRSSDILWQSGKVPGDSNYVLPMATHRVTWCDLKRFD